MQQILMKCTWLEFILDKLLVYIDSRNVLAVTQSWENMLKLIIDSPVQLTENKQTNKQKKISSECQDKHYIDLDLLHIILSITLNYQSIFCRHYGNPYWLLILLPKICLLKKPDAKFCDGKTNFPLVKNDFSSTGKNPTGEDLLESKCQGVDQTSQVLALRLVLMKVQEKGEKASFSTFLPFLLCFI